MPLRPSVLPGHSPFVLDPFYQSLPSSSPVHSRFLCLLSVHTFPVLLLAPGSLAPGLVMTRGSLRLPTLITLGSFLVGPLVTSIPSIFLTTRRYLPSWSLGSHAPFLGLLSSLSRWLHSRCGVPMASTSAHFFRPQSLRLLGSTRARNGAT